MKINSRWVVEKGRWDEKSNTFTQQTKKTFERIIYMHLEDCKKGQLLRFIGGPTGYESYYVKDLLLNDPNAGEMCICGGTINRWPSCYVNMKIVKDFIKKTNNEAS